MNKRNNSILLFVLSGIIWFFPHWNGFLFAPSFDVTAGDGRIVSSILLVGGFLLWYLPEKSK